ncbi:MAG: RNA-directed DNA polymerase, partial [Alphaproteobacteria bacterium]
LEAAKSELQGLYNHKLRGIMIRSRAQWVEHGERNSRFFLNLENRNNGIHYIEKIQDTSGNIVIGCRDVLNCLKNFYSNLYDYSSIDTNVTDLYFTSLPSHPTLSADESSSCEGVLTFDECENSIMSMSKNKSPGSDGFTTEFYSSLWPYIGPYVVDSLNFAFFCGHLSSEQCRAIIKLIPKPGKDPLCVKNWRPISLLNVDYKIAAKCIANRIKGVIKSVIHVDQTGFIKGRYIGESIRTILDLIDICRDQSISSFMLFIDFEKAFDSVSWYFIDKGLAAFNFGIDLRRWVKVLYQNSSACIVNNGNSSGFFNIRRGVGQGCPLSPYLFIICVEYLAIHLRSSSDFKGISAHNFKFKLAQYADDTTIFIDCNKNSLTTVRTILNDFCSASGLKINFSKSKLFPLGPIHGNVPDDFINSGFELTHGPIKSLGVSFTYQKADLFSLNYLPKLSRLKMYLNVWATRDITPIGKITILKSFGISQLVFLLTVLPNPPDNFIKDVNSIIYKFIWSNKPDKIKRDTLSLPYSEGGLNMLNLDYFKYALKISWVKRYLSGPPCAWKVLFEIPLRSFGGKFLFHCNLSPLDVKCIKNDFVRDVCIAWCHLTYRDCTEVIHNSNLWNNSNIRIDNQPIYVKRMHNSGILNVQDIISSDGSFLNFQQIRTKFDTPNIFFTTYYGLINAIPRAWKDKVNRNCVPFNHHENVLKKLLSTNKVAKQAYKDFVSSKLTHCVLAK